MDKYNLIRMAQEKFPQKDKKRLYTYQDLIQFSNTEIYSAFGEVRDSKKPTAPQYSFGTALRQAGPKKFYSKEMARIDCFGKETTKGPNYNINDKFDYQENPSWKMGTAPRNTLDTKAKYQHYYRKDIDVHDHFMQFDTNEADKVRRHANGNTRFGGQSRFPLGEKKYKMTPGPEYNPGIKPEVTNAPQFSLYARRAVKGFDPLISLTSTSEIVGPGSYCPQKSVNSGKMMNKPNWSIPKGPRDPSNSNKFQVNQTYDTSSSIGVQARSEKTTKPQFSCGKEKRNNPSGIFKAHMEYKPTQVRIDHPRF